MKPIIIRTALDNIASITIPRPSNFHAHFRRGALMQAVAIPQMRCFKYVLAMPNTGPIRTIENALEYHNELAAIAMDAGLEDTLSGIIMTLYLTADVTPAVVEQLAHLPIKAAVKYYPPHKGATTGSGLGIPLSEAGETLRAMARCGIRLLGHFEAVHDRHGHELPHDEREGYFMQNEFLPLREDIPDLHINIEHASTEHAVRRVMEDPSGKTTCGFTPHHLLMPIEVLRKMSWANHGQCMPIPKSQDDVDACREFATSGDPRAHLGDDTAPHLSKTKEGEFGKVANGCYFPHSLALYALAFERAEALDERFVRFCCYNGPDSWGLPRPDEDDTVTLVHDTKDDIPAPTPVPEENDVVVPWGWSLKDDRFELGLRLQ